MTTEPTPHDQLTAEIEADLAAIGITPADLAHLFNVNGPTDDVPAL